MSKIKAKGSGKKRLAGVMSPALIYTAPGPLRTSPNSNLGPSESENYRGNSNRYNDSHLFSSLNHPHDSQLFPVEQGISPVLGVIPLPTSTPPQLKAGIPPSPSVPPPEQNQEPHSENTSVERLPRLHQIVAIQDAFKQTQNNHEQLLGSLQIQIATLQNTNADTRAAWLNAVEQSSELSKIGTELYIMKRQIKHINGQIDLLRHQQEEFQDHQSKELTRIKDIVIDLIYIEKGKEKENKSVDHLHLRTIHATPSFSTSGFAGAHHQHNKTAVAPANASSSVTMHVPSISYNVDHMAQTRSQEIQKNNKMFVEAAKLNDIHKPGSGPVSRPEGAGVVCETKPVSRPEGAGVVCETKPVSRETKPVSRTEAVGMIFSESEAWKNPVVSPEIDENKSELKQISRHNSDKTKRKKEKSDKGPGIDIPIRKGSHRDMKFPSAPSSLTNTFDDSCLYDPHNHVVDAFAEPHDIKVVVARNTAKPNPPPRTMSRSNSSNRLLSSDPQHSNYFVLPK